MTQPDPLSNPCRPFSGGAPRWQTAARKPSAPCLHPLADREKLAPLPGVNWRPDIGAAVFF
jgi:hypothetical protein